MRLLNTILLLTSLSIGDSTDPPLCIGTCYTGDILPQPDDIFHGKHINGHTYKNITTDDQGKCYRHCVQDCRCRACQMKDATCELLDEDKTSKAGDFVNGSGYVYFDLRQTMYQGQRSHMVAPGECYNGCCRSQPCLNGGTCVEHCKSSKEKFTCSCTYGFGGKICERQFFSSCRDVYNKLNGTSELKNDIYSIERSDNKKRLKVFCTFNKTQGNTWVLIESFALKHKSDINAPFYISDFSKNSDKDTINWELYRLPLEDILYFKTKGNGGSTHVKSTCDYGRRKDIYSRDFFIALHKNMDLFTGKTKYTGKCVKFLKLNIRGKQCDDCTYSVYSYRDDEHFHIDKSNHCDFKQDGGPRGGDYFGHYDRKDEKFTCAANEDSITSWWIGETLD